MVNSFLYKTYLHILLVIQSLSSHAKVMFSVYWKISVFSKSQVKNQIIFYVLKLPNIGNHLYIWRRIVVALKSSRKTDIYTNFIQFQNLNTKFSKIPLVISNSYHSRHFGVPSQNDWQKTSRPEHLSAKISPPLPQVNVK